MNVAIMDLALDRQHGAMDATFDSDQPNRESPRVARNTTRNASRKYKEKETLKYILKLGQERKPSNSKTL